MSGEQLLREATTAVCGPIIADYRRGLIDEAKLEQLIARRRDQIAAWLRDRARSAKMVRCADCRRDATTVMNGVDYCDDHAKNHRVERPTGRVL